MNRFHFWHALTCSLSAVFLLFPAWTGIVNNANMPLQETPQKVVYDIGWSPDGSKIAVGYGSTPCDTHEIEILDAKTEKLINTLSDGSCEYYSFDWSPDSTKIATTSGFHIWDVAAGQIVMTIKPIVIDYVDIKWNPDGKTLAFSDGGVYLVDATTEKFTILNLSGSELDWSPDGTKLATGSGSQYENKVSVFDVVHDKSLFESEGGRNTVDWSPDGTKIVSSSLDHTVRIWDATSGVALYSLSGHTDFVNYVAWNPDSRRVASVSDDGTVRIWDAETGEVLRVIEVGSRVFAVAWSPDGSQLAYGGLEGTLTIVSVADILSATSTPIPTTELPDLATAEPAP